MKLSKQERIGILVIAIVLIIGLGIWLFIVPRFEAISASSLQRDNKVTELNGLLDKQKTKDDLKVQVMKAYEEGEDLADMFFEELSPYMADHEFRAFLEKCEANVLVESLSVSAPTTYTLAPTYFTEDEVDYALKTYVTQGLEPTEDEVAAANRLSLLQSTLGSSQTVGSTTITFTVYAIDQDELFKFCDEVNAYIKDENGTPTRKAVMLNGFAVDYPLVQSEFEEKMQEQTAEIEKAGIKELYDNFDLPVPQDRQNEEKDEDGKNDELEVTDYLYSTELQMTFFSVERMLDPSDQLKAQDEVIF